MKNKLAQSVRQTRLGFGGLFGGVTLKIYLTEEYQKINGLQSN